MRKDAQREREKMKKKLLCLLLTAAMLIAALAGCGGNENGENGDNGRNANGAVDANGVPVNTATEFVYVAKYTDLPKELGEFNQAKIINGKLCGFTTVRNTDYSWSRTRMFSAELDDSGLTWLEDEPIIPPEFANIEADAGAEAGGGSSVVVVDASALPPKTDDSERSNMDSAYIWAFVPNVDGTAWVGDALSQGSYSRVKSSYDITQTYTARKVDFSTGEVLSEITFEGDWSNGGPQYMALDADGNLVVMVYNYDMAVGLPTYRILVFNAAGEQLSEIEVSTDGGWVQGLQTLADGRIALLAQNPTDSRMNLKPIDFTTKKLGENIGTFPSNVYQIEAVLPDGRFVSQNNTQSGLIAFDPLSEEDTEPEKIVDWLDVDVDRNGIQLLGFEGDDILAIHRNYSNVGEAVTSELLRLTLTPASEVTPKKELTLACVYVDDTLKTGILNFNRKDGEYRIKVIDYSQYNVEPDWNGGMLKLNTEIMAGTLPDLLVLNDEQFSRSTFERRGVFEDLSDYIANEPGLELVSAALNASKSADGKLYSISSGFNVATLVGDGNVVGYEQGWTMSEANAAIAKGKGGAVFPSYTLRDTLINTVCTYNMDEYINWTTGEVKFDTSEFVELVEWIKTFPSENDPNARYTDPLFGMVDGSGITAQTRLGMFSDFTILDTVLNGRTAFKGYPCESKKGFMLVFNAPLSMSSQCKDKEGAWRFMSTILGADYQNEIQNDWSSSFPTNKAAFEQLAQKAMEDSTDLSKIITRTYNNNGGWSGSQGGTAAEFAPYLKDGVYPKGVLTFQTDDGDKVFPFYAMTQEQFDRFNVFLNGIDRRIQTNTTLTDIITEELAPFFAGQKSAAEAVRIVQSRIGIYVNEQR
jgi:ABC-type glycerol-3-phosphate transport system substrate-binding protein